MPRNQGALSRLAELMRRVNSSTDTEVILEEIAHGVVDVLGYGVAAIARLEGDVLVMTHVAGPPDVVAQILHRRTPAEQILDEFREADKWGILRFVPAGRMSAERLEAAWIPEFEASDDPDAWHPEHALYAPLYSAAGELLGNMAVDLPADGKVPDEADRELLEMFAVQAGVALSNARERERLTDRVRLDRMLTTVAGASTAAQNLSQALATAVSAVADSMQTVQTVVRTFPSDAQGSQLGVGTPYAFTPQQDVPEIREDLTQLPDLPVLIELGVDDPGSARLPRSAARMQQLMRGMRVDRALVCPLVSQDDLVGYLVLGFARNARPVTPAEADAVLEVGRLLAQTVRASRVLETEQRLVQELRELARYRSELIATISHELKTPLTAILGHAELIADRHPDLTSIDAIIRNAGRLNNLVANLLHYSRIQGRRETVRRAVDLAELCEASVDLLSIRAKQAGVALEFDHPGPSPVVVFGDPEELARVIDNMVDNAVKYTPEDGTVSVAMTVADDEVSVEVTDTGLGISLTDQQHVFSAFHRSTNPNALSVPGTGLGLPIAQRIAESHGGTLSVTSELGHGSTFRFTLPLRSPREQTG
ncbi:sensor histidine kinase [Nocardioides ganghwensis]|jgi:signal transduction histidine kinase|uniref:histidine kinase n=1 Tax=Nocardioides ganghwensis TaxID=252230 RepID=A0A4V1RMV0_9ACTN|nr:HAMP domain-containing sensor histidine kinase [Nocardioides ganghwensis]MBD3945196.1 HAMP domain-containing histidine kinase [Nocardioides ganghwensis]RYC03627.1 GAF domain-containing protein [Nocardioides ganghwensis]